MSVLLTRTDIPYMCMICFPGIPVRLTGGLSNVEGRVEVFQNNVWGTICDSGWDSVNSRVVCQTLFGDGYMYLFIGMYLIVCHKKLGNKCFLWRHLFWPNQSTFKYVEIGVSKRILIIDNTYANQHSRII